MSSFQKWKYSSHEVWSTVLLYTFLWQSKSAEVCSITQYPKLPWFFEFLSIHVFVWGVLIKMHIKFYTVNKKKTMLHRGGWRMEMMHRINTKRATVPREIMWLDHWTNSAAISLHSVLNFVLIILKRLSQRLSSKWFGITLTHTLSCYQAFPNICRREITWRCWCFSSERSFIKRATRFAACISFS